MATITPVCVLKVDRKQCGTDLRELSVNFNNNIVDSSTFDIANVNKMLIRFVLYAKTNNNAI